MLYWEQAYLSRFILKFRDRIGLNRGYVRSFCISASIIAGLSNLAACGAGQMNSTSPTGNVNSGSNNTSNKSADFVIQASSAQIIAGQSIHFRAFFEGSEVSAKWSAVPEGSKSSANTLISSDGIFTAPNQNENVIVTAQLASNSQIKSSVTVSVLAAVAEPGSIGFTYELPVSASTSAGVYNAAGSLVRTLWSNQQEMMGAHIGRWDGLADDGTRADDGSYKIKLLYNNVQYQWSLIGDTSQSLEGPNNWDTQASFPTDAALSGNSIIVTNGYAEGRDNAAAFDIQDPQSPYGLFKIDMTVLLKYVATDGTRAYFANVGTGYSGSQTFVVAYDLSSKRLAPFLNGSSISIGGRVAKGVIDLDPVVAPPTGKDREYVPTGIAVQQNGRLLAVAHGDYLKDKSTKIELNGLNTIVLYDKLTGSFLGRISILNPQRMAFDAEGDLWVISGRTVVQIKAVGLSNIVAQRLSNLQKPLALAIDPRTGDVLIADGGGSQQIKRFSENGQLLFTYGKPGGYTDCNPRVENDKFYLDSTAGPGGGMEIPDTWLVAQRDGSFWVGELANNRALHFAASGDYLGQFAFMRFLYMVAADHNSPTRIFGGLLEFNVDYNARIASGDPDPKLGGTGRWSLVNNWSVCAATTYKPGFVRVNTLPGGRTFAEMYNSALALPGNSTIVPLELVELPQQGPIRGTGKLMQTAAYKEFIDDDGNIAYWANTRAYAGAPIISHAYMQKLLHIEDVPSWGPQQELAKVSSDDSSSSLAAPFGFSGWGMMMFPKLTTGGYFVTYRTYPSGQLGSPHIGGVPRGGTSWNWRASPEALITSPDLNGSFPQQASYGGHNGIAALVEGSNIFQGYDGQWGTFSSQWMHWQDDGLLIGQFGHSAGSVQAGGALFPGAAGNIGSMATVSTNGSIYLYSSDEGYHPGIHQWWISGLDTVHELAGVTSIGQVASLKLTF